MLRIYTEEDYINVVEEFSNILYKIAYQNVLNVSDAEDIVQDVFVKMLNHKDKSFENKEHLKAWLIKVTINQSRDYQRLFARRKETPMDNDIPYGLEENEYHLLDEIARLPRDERNIIFLYYYEGYKIKEISEILNKNQNTVNSKLIRARKKLKTLISDEKEVFV